MKLTQILSFVFIIFVIVFLNTKKEHFVTKTKVNTLEYCHKNQDCVNYTDICTEFEGEKKRCLNSSVMKDMCSKKKLDLVTNKEGKRICQKSSFPEYDPEYTYQGPSQTNIRNYCLQGKEEKGLCTKNEQFANNCIEECGYLDYNQLVTYPQTNIHETDNFTNYCMYGRANGKCIYPDFATTCVNQCGYPLYNEQTTYPQHGNNTNHENYCKYGKTNEKCVEEEVANACIDECGFPGFNNIVKYPNETILINTNYENYCTLGKSRGLCETEKFPIGCRSECNK